MPEFADPLPAGTIEWISEVVGGRVTDLRRHVARREAWVVDVTRSDGSVLQGFLRLQRETSDVDPRRLERETRIFEALGPTGVPVPEVLGWNPELRAALFEFDPGRSDLDKLEDLVRQRAIMEDFTRIVARLHTLDLEDLGLDDVMEYKPTTPVECALKEVDLIVSQWSRFMARHVDPLTTYGLDWLHRFAPEEVARVALVQGDTGPVNFMFQDDRVSAVIDWELGHYGDPLEDLGNIAVREFWNPSGGLTGLFELYERESGIPYDRFRVQYYAVHQNVRGMIPIHYICENAHPREPVAWHLCYRYVGDRATCEMLADAMGIAIERPEMPEGTGHDDVLAEAAVYALENQVEPALSEDFAASRARDVKTLVACMDRRRRFGGLIDRAELDDLESLLGRRPQSLEAGRKGLSEAITERRLEDAALIPALARKAYREEWLYAPAAMLHPDRNWSKLD
ncbi:phosphotransferase [Myxococcota bacterium]|nr:phosphotransferase [Myxococcota bacterium]